METATRICWCGAATAVIRERLRLAPDEEYRLLECEGCGVVALDPQPTDSQLSRWYSADYYGGTARKFVGPAADFVEVFQRARARRVSRLFPRPARLLDVGCGNGGFLLRMKRRGWDVEGTEWTPESAARVPKSSGIPVHVGDLTTLSLPRRSFDVVTLWHVLEHVRDPRRTLEVVREILAPEGRLVLALPNAESRQARRYGVAWFHLDPPRHLFGFGPGSLGRLLDLCGFCVEDQTTFSLEQNPYGMIQSVLNSWGFPRDRAYGVLKGTSKASALSRATDVLLVGGLVFPALLTDLWESSTGRGATLTLVARLKL